MMAFKDNDGDELPPTSGEHLVGHLVDPGNVIKYHLGLESTMDRGPTQVRLQGQLKPRSKHKLKLK